MGKKTLFTPEEQWYLAQVNKVKSHKLFDLKLKAKWNNFHKSKSKLKSNDFDKKNQSQLNFSQLDFDFDFVSV